MPYLQSRRLSLKLVSCFAVLSALTACSPVRLLNALVPSNDFDVQRAVPYAEGDRHEADIYVPRASTDNPRGRPMVVFFYGGSWQSGSRRDYLFVGEALASRGIVTVIPDYRLYPSTLFPGFVEDAAAAVAWAKAHAKDYGADPERIFLMGHSAGAHIVMLLVTDKHYLSADGVETSSLAGAIGLSGPYDFLPLKDDALRSIFPASLRAASQPINHVSGHEPPLFLGVGLSDVTVDPGNTFRFAARANEAGDSVEVKQYAGINHAMIVGNVGRPVRALSPLIKVAPVLDDVTAFIDQTSLNASRAASAK